MTVPHPESVVAFQEVCTHKFMENCNDCGLLANRVLKVSYFGNSEIGELLQIFESLIFLVNLNRGDSCLGDGGIRSRILYEWDELIEDIRCDAAQNAFCSFRNGLRAGSNNLVFIRKDMLEFCQSSAEPGMG